MVTVEGVPVISLCGYGVCSTVVMYFDKLWNEVVYNFGD